MEKVRSTFHTFHDYLNFCGEKKDDRLLTIYEEQAYRGCLSLLKLADKYSTERLENACKVALKHIPIPRYRNIRLIIEAGQDLKESEEKTETPFSKDPVNRYTHLRVASYYGGANHE